MQNINALLKQQYPNGFPSELARGKSLPKE